MKCACIYSLNLDCFENRRNVDNVFVNTKKYWLHKRVAVELPSPENHWHPRLCLGQQYFPGWQFPMLPSCAVNVYIKLSKRTFRNIKVFHTLYIIKLTKLNIHLLTAKNLGTKIMPYTSLLTNKREIWDYTSGKNDENRLWNKAFMRDLGF